MVAVAIVGAGVLSAGATVAGSSAAASAQKSAANQANATQRYFYDQNKQILNPFITGGQQDYATLNSLLNPSTAQNTLDRLPGYQFTLGQGLKSVQNSAAARGLGVSGAALKGAAQYATGLANSTYGSYVNNLLGGATIGENAGAALAGVGSNTGNQISSNQIGAGNAQAAAYNSIGGAVGGAANNISQYYLLNSLLKNTNNSGAGPLLDYAAYNPTI
jgi:hypothetical protein